MSSLVNAAAGGEAAALAELNRTLETLSAEQRVAFSLEHLPGAHVLTSSFGAQAAVSLHLVTRQSPRLPVILLDTGYLFPETYAFVEKLTERLSLNLKVYRSTLSPAWIEARFGKLWEQGVAGLEPLGPPAAPRLLSGSASRPRLDCGRDPLPRGPVLFLPVDPGPPSLPMILNRGALTAVVSDGT